MKSISGTIGRRYFSGIFREREVENVLNFTIGPVMMSDAVISVGAEQVPYFRTPEFSEMMPENERLIVNLAHAPKGSRAVFLSGSGIAAMEAAVINLFTERDMALVIDGGSFGHRFVEILEIYSIPHESIRPESGYGVTKERLACPPGISVIAMNAEAVERAYKNKPKTVYRDLKSAPTDGKRGQTPFTPAVGILGQIHTGLLVIEKTAVRRQRLNEQANRRNTSRKRSKTCHWKSLPTLSNAMTPLLVRGGISAFDVFLKLKDDYGIWIRPSGGASKDRLFRIGHIGALQTADYDAPADAMKDIKNRQLL